MQPGCRAATETCPTLNLSVVCVVKGDELVALVGRCGAGLREVAANLALAVVDISGCDDLVTGMRKGGDRRQRKWDETA